MRKNPVLPTKKLFWRDEFLSDMYQNDCFIVKKLEQGLSFQPDSFYSYVFTYNSEQIALASNYGFRYTSSRLTLKFDPEKTPADQKIQVNKTISISSLFEEKDLPQMYDITALICKKSRFYKDTLFKQYAQKMYKQWIRNILFNHLPGRTVLFARMDTKLVGYLVLNTTQKKNQTRIELFGVAKPYQKMLVGSTLLHSALSLSSQNIIYVGTEAENIDSLNVYVRVRFLVDSYELIFHKHS